MLADKSKRNEILKAIRSGKLTSNATPSAVANLLKEQEVFIAEYELLVSVVGVDDYETTVKQGRNIITDPEGDGYAVDTGKNVTVKVVSEDKELEYKYKVDGNRDLVFNFDENKVIEK